MVTTSLYDLSVPTFLQTVRAVGGFLDRAAIHCAETGADPDDFVNARLFDDMAPFHFQIEAAWHHSVWGIEALKTGAFTPPALVGPVPFADLRAMIGKAETALEAFTPDEVNSWAGKALNVTLHRPLDENDRSWRPWAPRQHAFTSETFLLSFSLPNFHFHAVTAYDILRTRGVPLGKRDYEGQLRTRQTYEAHPDACKLPRMKPYIICHMVTSVDGRIWGSRWRPKGNVVPGLFERLHDQLVAEVGGGGSWLCGRVTAQEFAKGTAPQYPPSDQLFPRAHWFAQRDNVKAWGIFLDAKGKAVWARQDIGGDPILVILTEAVPDRHLAGLRADGVSYIFAGATEIDLAAALESLNRELGIDRILLEGGGGANGALLRAGLIDELSLVISPAIDGSSGAPTVFNSGDVDLGPAPIESMALASHEVLHGGAVWLRYRLSTTAS